MNARASDRNAVLLMIVATILWPVLEFTGVSMMTRHHAIQVVFLRYAVHLLLLTGYMAVRFDFAPLRTRRPVLQLLRGACMFGMPAAYVVAADFASSAWIWSMFWTMPALALIGATLLLGERPGISAWLMVAAGAVGAVAIRGGVFGGVAGTVIALCMAASFAGYIVLSRILRDEPLGASLFYTALGAIIPTAMIVHRAWTPIVAADIGPMIAVGMISIAILGAFDVSIAAAPLSRVAPLLSLVPVWETIALIPAAHVLPQPMQATGIVVIALGTMILFTGYFARQRQAGS